MAYDSIFIRDFVGETPNGPNTGKSWTDSPDIICSGTMPLPDPAVLTNQDNYNKGLPTPKGQTPLQNNFVYVRGINARNAAQTATIYLYYVDTTIVLWPQNWKLAGITHYNPADPSNPDINFVQVEAAANGIVATNPPFGWIPPRQGVHYCLVAWVKNGPDQGTPPDLYSIGSVQDMGNFILTHPNVGWRNTIEVDATQPTIADFSTIEGPTGGPGTINIGIQCKNLPTDGFIEFSVPGPDAQNTIIFPKSPILNPNYAPTFQVEWPAGFSSTITFKYYKGTKEPADGSNVIPFVGTWGTGSEQLKFIESIAPQRLIDVHYFGTPTEFAQQGLHDAAQRGAIEILQGVPIKKVMLVGSVPFKLKV